MAPRYEALSHENFDDDEDELDFSDLRQQYEVKMDEGLDAFVVCNSPYISCQPLTASQVIDGLPIVTAEQKPKLVKFLLKKLNSVGKTSEDAIYMPMDKDNKSEGFAFVEYGSPEQAVAATKHLHGTALDKKHTIAVNKITDIERYGREGRIDDDYTPPVIPPFEEKDHLRAWLGDLNARDQFLLFRGDNVGIYWNEKKDTPETVVDRKHWTQLFAQWSPQGTYVASMHQQGVQLWGGPKFEKQRQFAHPFVSLIEFSPGEKYLTTWSNQPIVVEEGKGSLSIEEDGKNIIIWDIVTGKVLRSFVSHDLPAPPAAEGMPPPKPKVQWPAFKWSADEKYVARMKPQESISIYELPRMNLLDKTSVKIEAIADFEWSPATPQREGVKTYEQLLCFWTPEILSNPAKVGLMSVPSKEIVRTRQMFNVTDAKLHWQSSGAYVCVKVDRHSKSKKSMATNLEIFRIKEKGVPVEVVDSLKDTVINFAWEPKGDRFVLITAGEAVPGSNVVPKTAVSFFCPEKVKGQGVGNFKLIRTIDKKNSNGIYWSPKGRFVVVATVSVQQFSDLDFWDLDYEGDKPESEANLSANLMLMNTADHYGVTDVEWDPTGRYVATSASVWTHSVSFTRPFLANMF
jgi:translation initiation factor 3 subunit B